MDLKNLFWKIGPGVVISVFAFIISLIFFIVTNTSVSVIYSDSTITLPLGATLFFTLLTLVRNLNPLSKGDAEEWKKVGGQALKTFLDWIPVPILLFVYENLKARMHFFTHQNYTSFIANLDKKILGLQPTLALEKIIHPLLTDIMALFYALYFAILFLCVFVAYFQNKEREFHISATAMVLCFYIGFVGYITVPVMPPRFFLASEFTKPLKGIILFPLFEGFYSKHNPAVEWGAFPSLHVGAGTLGLILSYKFRNILKGGKALFYFLLPVVAGLWFSTVYLRHHWIIDIIAGAILSVISYYLAIFLYNKWQKIFGFESIDFESID